MIKAIKYQNNPVITPLINIVKPTEGATYNPAAIVKNNKVYLLYRSETNYEKCVSQIKIAVSDNGFDFSKPKNNIIIKPEFKDEIMGCEDPRIVKIGNNYFITYTAYQGIHRKRFIVNLRGAWSKDLINWKKTEPLFKMEKSGAIVSDYKWKGQYVMYIGGNGIRLALSKDLKKWKLIKKPVLLPRQGNYFDNHLVEAGPPPIITDQGIVVIYNGKDDKQKFSCGVAIFDKDNPKKIIYRQKEPLIAPTEGWEKFGKINNVVFATGLVKFKNKWLLYYGGADKAIGVAEIKL